MVPLSASITTHMDLAQTLASSTENLVNYEKTLARTRQTVTALAAERDRFKRDLEAEVAMHFETKGELKASQNEAESLSAELEKTRESCKFRRSKQANSSKQAAELRATRAEHDTTHALLLAAVQERDDAREYLASMQTAREAEQEAAAAILQERKNGLCNLVTTLSAVRTDFSTLRTALANALARNNTLLKARDHLQATHDDVVAECDVLRAKYTTLSNQHNSLSATCAALRVEHDDLVAARLSHHTEKDIVVTENNALKAERNALKTQCYALLEDRHCLTIERDSLIVEHNSLKTLLGASMFLQDTGKTVHTQVEYTLTVTKVSRRSAEEAEQTLMASLPTTKARCEKVTAELRPEQEKHVAHNRLLETFKQALADLDAKHTSLLSEHRAATSRWDQRMTNLLRSHRDALQAAREERETAEATLRGVHQVELASQASEAQSVLEAVSQQLKSAEDKVSEHRAEVAQIASLNAIIKHERKRAFEAMQQLNVLRQRPIKTSTPEAEVQTDVAPIHASHNELIASLPDLLQAARLIVSC
jgi:chromosome segregation ATPase